MAIKCFFQEVSQKIGYCPSTLYALAKLLNGIGTSYIDDGIIWISNIIKDNKDILNQELETDTIYYLESLVRRFIYNNREKNKKNKRVKRECIINIRFF